MQISGPHFIEHRNRAAVHVELVVTVHCGAEGGDCSGPSLGSENSEQRLGEPELSCFDAAPDQSSASAPIWKHIESLEILCETRNRAPLLFPEQSIGQKI